MSLSAFLQVPELQERYNKLKKYFFLRESAYDVTSTCQLRCDGCYYFEGDKHTVSAAAVGMGRPYRRPKISQICGRSAWALLPAYSAQELCKRRAGHLCLHFQRR